MHMTLIASGLYLKRDDCGSEGVSSPDIILYYCGRTHCCVQKNTLVGMTSVGEPD